VILLLGAALIGGFGLGWLTAGPGAARGPGTAEVGLVTPVHAGVAAHAAAERIRQLSFVLPPVEEVAAPPPPPDIAVLFRRDLTAIEQTSAGPVVWVVDLNQPNGRRGLKSGDVYQDGWRLSAIRPQSIELRRRGEVRRVDLFATVPAPAP
jgi:hypothetical protein